MSPRDDLRPEASPLWLDKAKRNLDSAILNDTHGGYTDTTCYFCHQTAELALKAFVVHYSLDFKKTHDLVELSQICAQKDASFEELKGECVFLNPFYISDKYPMDPPWMPSKELTKEALEAAERVLTLVKKETGK